MSSQIEAYQKITNLARELLRHGEAKSMDEAVRIAEAQYRQNPGVFDAQASEQATSPQVMIEEPIVHSVASVNDTDGLAQENAMLLRKLQYVTANHTQKIEELDKKLMRMLTDMAEMRDAMRKTAESPIMVPRTAAKTEAADDGSQQAQLKSKHVPIIGAPAGYEASVKPRSHARTGNFKPDDVNIEKFFYFGRR